MTKSRGIGRGGARPNAGRRRGGKNRRKLLGELLPAIEAEDVELPLYALLKRASDESLDAKYRDMLRIACLPYTSPRLPSTLPCKPPHLMSDAELRETYAAEKEHQRQLARSRGGRPLLTLVKSK